MTENKCLYNCGSTVESNSDEYHVYPYSASEIEIKLPSGIVCDKCNSYFGRELENDFCHLHPGVAHKVLAVKETRKGKPPTQFLTHGRVKAIDQGDGIRNISYPPKDIQIEIDEGKKFSIKSYFESMPFHSRIISRTLAKMALELQLLSDYKLLDPYDPIFDSYKQYIRFDRGDYIWFAYLAEGIPSIQSNPRIWEARVSDEDIFRGVYIHFPGVIYSIPLPPVPPPCSSAMFNGREMFICDEDREYPGRVNELALVFTNPIHKDAQA